jgi:hypothetical protein
MSVLTINDQVALYNQPSIDRGQWGTLTYGSWSNVVGRTSDGWYAIDPGVAQAPNVGIYRLRWARTDARITLVGAKCGTLPVYNLAAPPAFKTCTVTPVNVSSVTVYSQSTFDAGVWGPLNAGATLPVVGQTPKNWFGASGGWYAVEVNPGIVPDVGRYALKWIPIDNTVQLNGDCEGMPVVTLDP